MFREEPASMPDCCPRRPEATPPALAVVGFSGSGKTCLITGLIGRLARCGLKVGTIKHHCGDFEMDRPGKDSWRHKEAGAAATMIASPSGIGLVMDTDTDRSPKALLKMMPAVDLVILEGYKHADLPKIEIYRPETGQPPVCRNDPHLIAVACDVRLDWPVPRFGTRQHAKLANFVVHWLETRHMCRSIK